MMNKVEVSIVIVCMNNLKNIVPCLQSIEEQTSIAHDIWVNAYMFSEENLNTVRTMFPFVHWVVNNNIAGFSENNNMCLRQINTDYVLILNDDTKFKEPVLDELMDSIKRTPNASIMIPKILNGDGTLQFCGRPPYSTLDFIRSVAYGYNPDLRKSKFICKPGIFKTYNVPGACFLIKREIFEILGYFDEYFFFCPEDIALSTLANQKGYYTYCNSDISLYHFHGVTSSLVKSATRPAERKGCILFYANGSVVKYYIIASFVFAISYFKMFVFLLKRDNINYLAQKHCVETVFSKLTPKQIFTRYYLQLKSR